jgi:hypothetical protein
MGGGKRTEGRRVKWGQGDEDGQGVRFGWQRTKEELM